MTRFDDGETAENTESDRICVKALPGQGWCLGDEVAVQVLEVNEVSIRLGFSKPSDELPSPSDQVEATAITLGFGESHKVNEPFQYQLIFDVIKDGTNHFVLATQWEVVGGPQPPKTQGPPRYLMFEVPNGIFPRQKEVCDAIQLQEREAAMPKPKPVASKYGFSIKLDDESSRS